MSTPLVSIFPPFSPGLPTNTQRHTQTNGVSGSNGGPANPLGSASLYLYTFLATLVLLIAISLFVITRSIVQRRRHDRAVREAWFRYTNGSIPFREGDLELIRFVEFRMNQSGVGSQVGRIDLSKLPTMWEVRLAQKKLIDSEKTKEGKLISSLWKLHQRSIPYLDLKSSFPPSWAWSSILPLSSTLLPPDGVTAPTSIEDGLAGNLPLGGVGRFFGRVLNGSASASTSGRGTPSVDQRRSHAPASASESPIMTNPNTNPVDGGVSTTIPPSPSDNPIRGLSGSSSHPHNSTTTHPSMDSPTTTERTESTSTQTSDQHPRQGAARDAHISPNIPLNPQNSSQGQNHTLTPQHQKTSSGIVDEGPRMRVAVLVCMPTRPTPSNHYRLSKTESKAKAKAGSKDSMDEKRLSSFSRSTASTLGGGEQRDDTDADGLHLPPLEVGLADVPFPGCGAFGER